MKLSVIFSSLFLCTLLLSCSDDKPAETPAAEEKPKVFETFEQRVRHEVETKLEIPHGEKYTLRIYKKQLDADGIEDAVITVNRAQFAQDEAIKSGKAAKMAETDFSGYYNYMIHYDGGTDKFSPRIYKIGSSPARELDVEFEHITSAGQLDICISYRIRNSGFRKFYTIKADHEPELMFEWEWFSKAGEDDSKAIYYDFVHDMSPISKDIVLYESEIDNNSNAKNDIYKFEPEITKKGKMIYHFFYDPNYYKYRGLPNE